MAISLQILVISNYYPPYHLGGQELSCQEAIQGLRARSHSITVLTSRNRDSRYDVKDNSVRRELYPEMSLTPNRAAFDFFINRRRHEKVNLEILGRAVDDLLPDLIFIWGMWNLPRSLAIQAEILLPGRVVYRFADYWPTLPNQYELYWQAEGRRRINRWFKNWLRPFAISRIQSERKLPKQQFTPAFCVSRATRDSLVNAGIPVKDATIIHTGLKAAPFLQAAKTRKSRCETETNNDPLKVIYSGRFSPEKGINTLLTALTVLAARYPVPLLKVTFAGGGGKKYHQALPENSLRTAGITVHFLGQVPTAEMPSLLASQDILVVPSSWEEPLSRSVMEGMAAGIVVVSTPLGGTKEIIRSGDNGVLFPAGDSNALADVITSLASQPQLRKRLAQAGQRTILKNFSYDQMINNMEAFLREALERSI